MTKRFTVINDGFRCGHCGLENGPAPKTCRNHCIVCLFSRHVDHEFPGDRASECGGLMEPQALDYSGKKGYLLLHRCLTCGKKTNNTCAPDDRQDSLFHLVTTCFHGTSDC